MGILNQLHPLYFAVIAVIFTYMTFWYVLSIIKKRSDLADEAWGLGFITIALTSGIVEKFSGVLSIITVLVSVWGLRLFWHIYKRHQKTTEDARYQELKRNGQMNFWNQYVKIYLFQGILMILVATPIIFSSVLKTAFNDLKFYNYLGLAIWTFGFIFESTADVQLRHFLSEPQNKGKLMTSGLWHYSRHPNYFGEITMWWGIFILIYSNYQTSTWVISAIGPLTITILILFVSGVPLMEKRYVGRKDWEEYAKKTSVLIPWFKKR